MTQSVVEAYRSRVARGDLVNDPAQAEAAAELDALAETLARAEASPRTSTLGWLFGGRKPDAGPRGLYLHGGVGRGKTMLMDLFFDAAPVRQKRRVHFHAFMADVHVRIHAWRQAKKRHEVRGDDPIAPVAAALAADARLLCFDEFAVTDIADAMILGRLFTALFADGITTVATSNVAPPDLYAGGLNRALFLPFIAMLEQHMEVLRLDAAQDFRLTKLSRAGTWFVPADARARAALDGIFASLTGGREGAPLALPLLGREVHVPCAAGDVARFGFADLCEAPLGAADFLRVAERFNTVLVDGIRVMAPGERNIAKRFITMIDAFYDASVKLIASAAVEPQRLYAADDGREVFEFDRTVSRLIEMRSDAYLASPHRGPSTRTSGDLGGLIET